MDKYIGNKRVLLASLGEFVHARCPGAQSIIDIFSGTTNVSRYFRKRGYSVSSNDLNRFCFILGATYLSLRRFPQFDKLPRMRPSGAAMVDTLRDAFRASAQRDKDQLFPLARTEDVWTSLSRTRSVQVLAYLNELDVRKRPKPSYITDYFTQFGGNSDFHSVRGSKGKRNYFSELNARRIDAVLECIRNWWHEGRLTASELHFLMTSLIEEVVITANVNGTFHDFNRNRLWPNSLQRFFLKVPLTYISNTKSRVYCADAMDLVRTLPTHDVMYIDPPYNFRQYSAYYHFLNFIAAYPFLLSVESYLGQLAFVRGQNTRDDFSSDFCFRERFVDALRALILQAPCRYVVMSYYGGRNHWNHWSRSDIHEDTGFKIISDVFNDTDLFRCSTNTPVIQLRQNYQSRNGERKQVIDEYFFFGERSSGQTGRRTKDSQELTVAPHNERLGLEHFRVA